MKKKIAIIIIAVLLCTVLLFTFVACGKKKQTGVKIEASEQAEKEAALDAWLDAWLAANKPETAKNQTKAFKQDLVKAQSNFTLIATNKTKIEPAFNIKYDKATTSYTITVTWAKASITKTYTKKSETAEYGPWSGNYSKVEDDWLLDSKASSTVDAIVAAGLDTVNYITGNAITGKFGADGELGIIVKGKSYSLRVKGNVDLTADAQGNLKNKADNELGFVIVNDNDEEIGGLYYQAAATAKDSKVYLKYPQMEEDNDGNNHILRDENNAIVYNYIYLNYADICQWVFDALRDKDGNPYQFATEAGKGAIHFEDEDGEIEVNGLGSLLDAAGAPVAQFVDVIVNTIAKAYKNGNRYYVDINLGSTITQVSELMKSVKLNLDFLNELHIDLANLKGLLGHITISADISDGIVSGFELAVNIPKCEFSLNNLPDGDANQLKFDIPAISFAIYLDDFSFLTTDAVEDVVPTDVTKDPTYFSPTNLDLSGEVYIKRTEGYGEGQQVILDDTFHYALATSINPMEIVTNGYDSESKVSLEITQSQGDTYDKNTATNFLSVYYYQKTRTLCVSGTAIDEADDSKVYKFVMDDKATALTALKTWLGIDNWLHVHIDANTFALTVDEEAKASAKALLDNDIAKYLVEYYMTKLAEYTNKPAASTEPPASADSDTSLSIDDYFKDVKALYNKYIEAKSIVISLEDGFSFKAEVSLDMMNEVIALINSFGAEIDPISDPQYANVYIDADGHDGGYITVKYDGKIYELTVDGGFVFKMTYPSNRSYEFKFTLDSATFVFEIKDQDGNSVECTTVRLSNFTFLDGWGNENPAIKELTPGEDLIFPADGTGPATTLAELFVPLLTNENTTPAVKYIGEFICRQLARNKADEMKKEAATPSTPQN